MDLYRKFIDTAVVKAIAANPALSFLILGSLLFFASTRDIIIFKVNIAPYLTDLGRTIVIAGVFSVILKSVQFSAIFREIIMAAIYNPAHIDDEPLLLKNWRLITEAIFSRSLPLRYPRPTGLLDSRYIDSKADYHFTDFQIQYDIDIGADGRGSVSNTLKTDILLAPGRSNPVFVQTIEGDGATTLLWLRINDKKFETYDFQSLADNPRARKLTLNLLDHINPDTGGARLERAFRTEQNVHSEPFINATLTRFINGAVIKTRVSNGYHIRFMNDSIEMPNDDPVVDTDGYMRWVLATPGKLLLPGQGYTLVIVKDTMSPYQGVAP